MSKDWFCRSLCAERKGASNSNKRTTTKNAWTRWTSQFASRSGRLDLVGDGEAPSLTASFIQARFVAHFGLGAKPVMTGARQPSSGVYRIDGRAARSQTLQASFMNRTPVHPVNPHIKNGWVADFYLNLVRKGNCRRFRRLLEYLL